MTTSTIPIRLASPRAASPAYARVMSVLSIGGLANFALVYFVQPLLPDLAAGYGVSAGVSGLALSSTTLAMMVGLFVAGPFSDRIGRSRAIAVSLVASGVLTLAGAAMPTWELFLATRAAAGLALAILPAVALAYVRDSVGSDRHLRANALYIAGTAVGGAVGRLAPLPLSLLGGWQAAAVTLGLLSIGAGVASILTLPADAPRSSRLRASDLLGGALASFRDGRIALICAVGLTAMAVFVSLYNAISFRLQVPPFSLGHAESLIYLAYLPGVVAPVAFRATAERFGRGATTVGAIALMAASIAVLAIPHLAAVGVGLGMLTFAFLGLHSILSGWVVDTAHRAGRNTSRASSAYLLAFYLGSTVAGTASTHVWADSHWMGVTIMAAALAVASTTLAVVLLRMRRR